MALQVVASGHDGVAPEVAPLVSVVLPCLNEAGSVGACVTEALESMAQGGVTGEVIVVDNGSTDESARIAAACGARIVHEPVRGYGAALRAGFRAASGEIVVMSDADLTYPLDRIPDLIAPLIAGEADIVYGGRLEAANRRNMPALHRYVGTPALTFALERASGGLGIRDSQSGFRAFRRATIDRLGLRSSGMELNSELLIKAGQAGMRVREIPTGYRPRVGQSKLRTLADGWRNLRTILLLAPDLILIWPGALLAAVGAAMTGAAFVSPQGVAVGSLRWQPVFFSSIALVVGVLAVLTGMLLAHCSKLVPGRVRARFAWLGTPRTASVALVTGAAALGLGLLADSYLLMNWAGGHEAPSRGAALASLAQSSIMLGSLVGVAGLVARLLVVRRPFSLVATGTHGPE